MTVARDRVQQAQTQQRDLLTQLAAVAGGEQRTMGRQGHDVLQLAQALQEIEQEIDAAEAECSRACRPLDDAALRSSGV